MEEMNTGETEEKSTEKGSLRVDVVSAFGSRPVENATVTVSYSGQEGEIVTEVVTDNLGRIPIVELEAPNIDLSLEPSTEQPYATYDVKVSAEGFEPVTVNSCNILSGELAIQNIRLVPEAGSEDPGQLYVIGPHTLYGDYPPKIAEDEIKKMEDSGEIVLSEVVIPEYIIVHDGPPTDRSAKNYYVKYKDYIKNVASCEIYSTWPIAALIANILAIQSITLNRVYTEWYRNKGLNFTITSSTAFDQKFIPGRNIFKSISSIVDQMFVNYLSRPGVIQPIFTQYCDGINVQCDNWMTQWGSKQMADEGKTAIEILRYYYGDNMYIETAEEVSGVPASWGKVDLKRGSSGQKVRQMQSQLNQIGKAYSVIPRLAVDGIFGPKTEGAVKKFQETFGLPPNGIVDYPTWYKISEIYVAVSRIAE